jgi:uncharacterized protein YuzE
MQFNYDSDTDSLYINFIDIPGVDSYETSPDYIVDIDDIGRVDGLEIINVKDKVDFNKLIFDNIIFNDIRFINSRKAV